MTNTSLTIELHADDYAQTLNTSKDILALMKDGCLGGISILTNMPCFDECMELLESAIKGGEIPFLPKISIHLDLVEGRMLSAPDTLMPWSWGDLFKYSYPIINVKEYMKVQKEVHEQISVGLKLTYKLQQLAEECKIPYEKQSLRIDSHQHAHMLPIVWKAIMNEIDGDGLKVEYIRNSHEPLWVFIKNTSGACKWNPVGIIKNRVLAFMAPKVERWYRQNGLKQMYLWGLIMTGHMDIDRIHKVMPDMTILCNRKNRNLELNIHPGVMLPEEMCPEVPEDSAADFYLVRENREVEAATAREFH